MAQPQQSPAPATEQADDPNWLSPPLAAAILFWLFWGLCNRYGMGLYKPMVTQDGAYQTFGMLDRLSHGQFPGHNYVPYLGVLLCYALAPIYFLLGQSPFAAITASVLMLGLGWFTTLWVFCRASGRQPRRAIRVAACLYLVSFAIWLVLNALQVTAMHFTFDPGPSLITFRDMTGVWLAMVTIRIAEPAKRRRYMAIGGGALLLWSPTAGVAVFLVANALQCLGFLAAPGPLSARIGQTAGNVALSLVALLLVATVASIGHPITLLQRIYLDGGGSQFWFFGPYGDRDHVLNVLDVFYVLWITWDMALLRITLTGFVIGFWWQIHKRRGSYFSAEADAVLLVCITQAVSALLAQVGGHVNPYYFSTYIGSAMGLGLVLIAGPLERMAVPGLVPWEHASWRPGKVTLLIGVVSLVAMGAVVSAILRRHAHAPGNPGGNHPPIWVGEIGATFPGAATQEVAILRQRRADMDRRQVPADSRMMAAYYGWSNVLIGADLPPRVDSIIHLTTDAERADFIGYLRQHRPELIATLNQLKEGVEPWNLRSSWPFYREVLANYAPDFYGARDTYWRRNASPYPAHDTAALPICQLRVISPSAAELTFTGPLPKGIKVGFLDIAVTYSATSGKPGFNGDLGRGYVRVTDRSSAFLKEQPVLAAAPEPLPPDIDAGPGIWYGLPMGRHSVPLPVNHISGETSRLIVEALGGAQAQLSVSACQVTNLLPDPLFEQATRTKAH